MAKTQKPNEEEKIVKENIQKRFKNMFTGENEPPATMSIKEVEALQARVAELESKLVDPQATPLGGKVVPSTVKPVVKHLPSMPAEKHSDDQHATIASALLEKSIRLWAVGIMAAIGLLFFG